MSETQRIVDLPRMAWDTEALRSKWTQRLRRVGGDWTFLSDQALGLEQAERFRGGFFPVTTGGGKTLLGMALPLAMGIDPGDTVILCPPGLESEAAREREKYLAQFDLEPTGRSVRYVPYSVLSREGGITLLDELAPKLIIADEAHNLRNKDAARTGRFLRYMRAHPDTAFVAMSATFTTSALKDFAHLATLALRDNSPLPNIYSTAEQWGRCIDVKPEVSPSGFDWRVLEPLIAEFSAEIEGGGRTKARSAFRTRLECAPGVVISDGDSCDRSLTVRKFQLEVPEEIRDAIRTTQQELVLPNGSEIDGPMHAVEKSKQLALGFYYYPDWPNGEPDRQWLARKREYNAAVFQYVKKRRKGLDTPWLVERALINGELVHTELLEVWAGWKEVRHRLAPPQAVEWVSTEIMEAVLEYARGMGEVIVWANHGAVFQWFRDQGVAVSEVGKRPLEPNGGVMVASIASHGTGYNLQEYAQNLVIMPPSNAGAWQQLLGRTHRAGQTRDVLCDVLQHTSAFKNSWATARRQARYIEETMGLRQKLNHVKNLTPDATDEVDLSDLSATVYEP
jgi:hypothetical protein